MSVYDDLMSKIEIKNDNVSYLVTKGIEVIEKKYIERKLYAFFTGYELRFYKLKKDDEILYLYETRYFYPRFNPNLKIQIQSILSKEELTDEEVKLLYDTQDKTYNFWERNYKIYPKSSVNKGYRETITREIIEEGKKWKWHCSRTVNNRHKKELTKELTAEIDKGKIYLTLTIDDFRINDTKSLTIEIDDEARFRMDLKDLSWNDISEYIFQNKEEKNIPKFFADGI